LDIFSRIGQYQHVLSDRLGGWPIVPVLNWMAQTGRHLTDANDLTRLLALQMVDVNAPIVRLRLTIRTNDEDVQGWSAVWQLGQPFEPDRIAQPGFLNRKAYHLSPLSVVDQTQELYRVQLDRDGVKNAHAVLRELAAQGATDYVALPLRIASPGLASIVLVTERLDGFTCEDIRKFAVLASIIAPTFEVVFLHRHS